MYHLSGSPCHTLLLKSFVSYDWVVYRNAFQVVVLAIVLFDKFIRNVGHVVPGVALAGDISLIIFHTERFDEVLPKAGELLGKFNLVSDSWRSLRVAYTNWLLDPDDICQVGPGVRVRHRTQSPRLPEEGTILGEKTGEGAAAGASVEPDQNLVFCGRIL